jgi:hypothetical protein
MSIKTKKRINGLLAEGLGGEDAAATPPAQFTQSPPNNRLMSDTCPAHREQDAEKRTAHFAG